MNKLKFTTVLILISTYIGFGQNNLLTIQQVVESAYNQNAELQQLRAMLKQKQNVWRSETGISSPEISYFKEGVGSGPSDVFDEKRLSVSQEIDFPLTTYYRLKGIAEEVKALEFQIKSKEKGIKVEVKTSYVEVLYALYLQKSRQNQLKLAQDLYNAVYTKFEIGMANGIDLANVELRMEEAKKRSRPVGMDTA